VTPFGDSDDRELAIPEPDRPPHDPGVRAETVLPESMADDRMRDAGHIV